MSNELMTLAPAQYPALDPNNDRVKLIMQNLGGEQLSVADFTRIKVPSQGGTKWLIETAAGTQVVDVLEGVILFTTRRRAYWKNPNPSQTPPDCASVDMITGIGEPGGDCAACPYNEFGSAVDASGVAGKGKACKEGRLFFLLRQGQVLPDVVKAPPGSLKNVRKYLMDLSQAGAPYCAVVTQFALVGDKNEKGTPYAKITAKMAGRLDEASYKNVLATIAQYQGTFEQVATDFVSDDEPQEV